MGTAKKSTPAVVETAKPPALSHDYGADAGAGFEGTKSSDLAIPFLNVMQSNSPSVVDGIHKSGDIVNSVTGEVYAGEDGVPFQPVHHEHKFVKWRPRDAGGGILGTFDPEDPYVAQTCKLNGSEYGKLKTQDGNELIETHYVYGLILNDAGNEAQGFAVIAYTSTKITPYRKWSTAMFLLKGKPPLFANRARMVTINDKNDKGQAFKNVEMKPLVGTNWLDSLIPPSTPDGQGLLTAAKELREMILSGMAKAAYDTQDTSGDPAPAAGNAKAGAPDGPVPF